MTPIQIKLDNFIENQRGFSVKPYSKMTNLQEDLGIYGDDASEFFINFSKEFNVDISNFSIEPYFDNEGSGLFLFFSRLFTGKNKGLKRNKKTMTIEHLEKAIALGFLDDSIVK